MEVSIVRAQVVRARESVEFFLAEEPDAEELDQIAEALEALQRAEACIYAVIIRRSAGLGQCMTPLTNPPQSKLEYITEISQTY